MVSPARRHFLAVTAGREAAAPPAVPTPLKSRMSAMLQAHLVALKAIKSVRSKIAAKALYLPEYADYVAGVLAADAGGDDLVVVTMMVWHLDVGDYDAGLAIAAYALRHGLELPERYSRDLPTLLLEEIAEQVLAGLAAGDDPGPAAADALGRALELTDDADLHDVVRAKAHKARGLLLRGTDPATAAVHLRSALTFDPTSGVKTELGKLQKQLAATPAGDAVPAAGSADTATGSDTTSSDTTAGAAGEEPPPAGAK